MEELSHAGAQLASRASSWVVDTALLVIAVSVGLAVVIGLGGALLAKFRDLFRAGATPGQVQTITERALDRKINGGLNAIKAQLAEVHREVRENRAVADRRHEENVNRLGLITGRLEALDRPYRR